MKKLAIFVEGQTEQIFISKLLEVLVNKHNIAIGLEKVSQAKNNNCFLQIEPLDTTRTSKKFYVLIRDCCGDSSIKTYIKESYDSLVRAGHEKIIGVWDVYPKTHDDLLKIKQYLYYKTPSRNIPVKLVLSIMEVESWFIAENSHFLKIDKKLTKTQVLATTGIDISPENVENIPHPTGALKTIYKTVGKNYNKKKDTVTELVNIFDYENLYLDISKRVSSFGRLIKELDSFLS